MTTRPDDTELLRQRLHRCGLFGLAKGLPAVAQENWLLTVLECEEAERKKRSMDRRFGAAHLGQFKTMADFDWRWPKKVDREAVEELFTLDFLKEGANVLLLGPNGVGKSMMAKNLGHQALLRGHTVRFTAASDMLHDLTGQKSDSSLSRRLRRYCLPQLLIVDEVGYLSYDNRAADLLFEVVNRRQQRSIVITTNKAFTDWKDVFPNAGCVVTLIDRLIHRSEIISVDGESYRLKEAKERAANKARARKEGKRT